MQKEGLGQVGVAILFDQVAETAQHRQQPRGGAARAGTDFEQAQAALAVRSLRRAFGAQAFAQHKIEMVGDEVVLVDAFDKMHRRLGKHHVGRGHRAAQDLGQTAQAGFDQREIGAMVGVGAPRPHGVVPARPQRLERFGRQKTPARRLRINSVQTVAFKMAQRGVKPSPVRRSQHGDAFGRRVFAVRIGEQRTYLGRHDRGGQTLGISG